MNGEVIGINSAKLASTEVEGMGYAIAISDVTDTLENLMNETPRDKVDNHGVLGITGMSVSEEAAKYYGVQRAFLSQRLRMEVLQIKPASKKNLSLQNLMAREYVVLRNW